MGALMNAAYDVAPDLVDPSEPLKCQKELLAAHSVALTGH